VITTTDVRTIVGLGEIRSAADTTTEMDNGPRAARRKKLEDPAFLRTMSAMHTRNPIPNEVAMPSSVSVRSPVALM